MANQLLVDQVVTYETLAVLKNNLKILSNVHRDYSKDFGKPGAKIGDTEYVRKPARFIVSRGSAYQPQPLIDTSTPITLSQQSQVSFEYDTWTKKLSLDDSKRRYIDPAAIALANDLDYSMGQFMMVNTANSVGVPGTTPGLSGTDATLTFANANRHIYDEGFARDAERTAAISTAMEVGWVDFLKQFYNPSDMVSQQMKKGQIATNFLGNKWYVDQNVPTQTIGLLGGTPAVNGAGQTGTSIITNGWTATTATLAIGDVISFAGVYAVNPQSRASTGSLRQFVIQALGTADGSGNMTVTILPAIVPSGQFQNVTASPATGALINIYDVAAAGQSALSGLATQQGLLWTREAFTFLSFPGDVPDNAEMAYEAKDPETGVSLRYVRMFDLVRDMWPCRMDIYWGPGLLYQEGACRISG